MIPSAPRRRRRQPGWIVAAFLCAATATSGQSPTGYTWAKSLPAGTRIHTNVVYGMYSGLALLMDAYQPREPNGYGIVFIAGSAWSAPLNFDAPSLKDQHNQFDSFGKSVLTAGYVVFVINHRATPRFHYPEPVEDAQRAVRFIRLWAKRYGIHADRIGALGYSSGANLAAMLGVLSGDGKSDDPDPVNRQSARVQCVVGGATPADLTGLFTGTSGTYLSDYIGIPVHEGAKKSAREIGKLSSASPFYYVGSDASPMMFFHGDADQEVPIAGAEKMQRALQKFGVPAKVVRISGGTHGNPLASDGPKVAKEIVAWFDQYLKGN